MNYALGNLTKDEFIKELTTGILPAPQYFAKNANLNKSGYGNYDKITSNASRPLSISETQDLLKTTTAIILDVRKPQEFAQEHIPHSIFIGIDGQFAPWVGALITDLKQAIILVTPEGREAEAVMRLTRVGYDNCIGYVEGGIDAWKKAGNTVANITSIDANEFAKTYNTSALNVLDVRKPSEYESGHIENVCSKPLDFITDWEDTLDKDKEYHIHCAGGYRSMIAASLLKRKGFAKLIDITGGFGAIAQTDIKTISKACTATKS